MYVGQALKEVFQEERPKPPAIQMQQKWSNEFSLPSTHAMGSLSMAASILYFALERYQQVDVTIGIAVVVVWVTVISLSRVYLGMHSVLDLVLGCAITLVLLAIFLPLTDKIEYFFAESSISPLAFVLVPILLIFTFPTSKTFTPTRGDTCSIAGVFAGVELGNWLNYQLGNLSSAKHSATITAIDWNDAFANLHIIAARTVLGLAVVGLTELLGKLIFWAAFSSAIGADRHALKSSPDAVDNTKKNFVDLSTKFATYCWLGCNALLVANLFKYLNIARESFFSEY